MLESSDITKLIKSNPGELNGALVSCATVWGLKAAELSLVETHDVLDDNAQLKKTWILRREIAFNGHWREIETRSPYLIPRLEAYLAVRRRQTGSKIFFLDEDGKPFKVVGGRPTGMDARFKDIFMMAGYKGKFSYKDFRNSLAIHMNRESGGRYDDQKGIQERLGIRSPSALWKILSADTGDIKAKVKGIYKRL